MLQVTLIFLMDFQTGIDLSCSVCQEVFKDPVLLSCSHSICKDCLKSWWREKPTQECPVCRRRSSRSDPPRNLALRNLCEDYVQQREQKAPEEEMCQVHSERLKLFCLTDQQPVCVVCRDSRVHEHHRFRPIAEAAEDLKGELDKSLLPLKENLQTAMERKMNIKKKADNIKKQFHQTKTQIQAEFKKLHQFLAKEEESRMKALRKEVDQKSQKMKDKIAVVSGEIEALSEIIRATEEQLRATDVRFLLRYNAAMKRVQRCPLLEEEPQLDPGALIGRAKHLGNLSFNIWTNMKRMVQFTPVILDPTRVMNVVLSDDLTSFRFDGAGTDQGSQYHSGMVFGSDGFYSGSHCWDVEVGNNEKWMLAVMTDPLQCVFKKDEPEMWGMWFSDGKYEAGTYNEDIFSLRLVSNLRKIRVYLDCDKHKVSFYDLDTNGHIHTFTQISHIKLFPIFETRGKSLIRILPQL